MSPSGIRDRIARILIETPAPISGEAQAFQVADRILELFEEYDVFAGSELEAPDAHQELAEAIDDINRGIEDHRNGSGISLAAFDKQIRSRLRG